jgi:hypothetical protein
MATIKRKSNGRIILKNGKVSCSCCGEVSCVNTFYRSNANVFQITKEEYDKYRAANGKWKLSGSETFNQVGTLRFRPGLSSKTGSVSLEAELSGPATGIDRCSQDWSHVEISPVTFTQAETPYLPGTFTDFNYRWTYILRVLLKTIGDQYFVRFESIGEVGLTETSNFSFTGSTSDRRPCTVTTRVAAPTRCTFSYTNNPISCSVDGNGLVGCTGFPTSGANLYSWGLWTNSKVDECYDGIDYYSNNDASNLTYTFIPNP